ncbi:MAG: hypothetical protein HYZ20_13715 [Burkholderiales bacterium]|nr:hypothetical protein [Burkholderiales bacterium]
MTGASPRRLLAAAAIGLAAAVAPAAAVDEAAVREALQRCVAGWNDHEPRAFGDCLTADVWFSEADDSFYKRFVGRDKVLGMFDYNIRNSDLHWEVVRIKPLADGSVAVQLKQRVGILPLKDGKYAMSFDRDPSLARLRREGKVWKVYFFTSHRGWARALIDELDAPPKATTPPEAAAVRPAPPTAAAPAGAEPAAYTTPFGDRAQGCIYCHGRPPALSDDPKRGRIVAAGAAAADGAALRRAMTQPRVGGMMDNALADPSLTDEALEEIRRWLVTLRDGRAEVRSDRILIHNPRSDRDPPARIVQLRAEGDWRLPSDAGCRVGTALAGGSSCEIRMTGSAGGALVYRFADSPGLQPQPVRVIGPPR